MIKICANPKCKKEFETYNNGSHRNKLSKYKRPSNAKTCCHKCSLVYGDIAQKLVQLKWNQAHPDYHKNYCKEYYKNAKTK